MFDKKEYRKNYYLKNRDKVLAKSKEWYQGNKEHKAAYDLEYYKNNKERVDERSRKYRNDHPEISLECLRRARAKFPEKDRARHILNYQIEKGEITKSCSCIIEGCDRTDLHGHHNDYNKPLEVDWVCAKHHHEIHTL